jgi:hypothetical protein
MPDDKAFSAEPSEEEKTNGAATYAEKLSEMIELWERAGVNYEEVVHWVDRFHVAARVADRFRREQPTLATAMAKAKSLETDAALQTYLERWVRKWELDEPDAYRQLILLGQGFVTAPSDPAGFGLWFQVIHHDRWDAILEQTGLTADSIFDFIRHVMEDDGLSSLDLFERMIDMSDHGTSDNTIEPTRRQFDSGGGQ